MNTPPFLLFAALLFWGWQTGHVFLGAVAGALVEASRFIHLRWSLTQADFNRLWNVCTVLFIGVGTYLLINEGTVSFNDFFADAGRRPEAIKQAGKSALVWFQWLPFIFLPFMLAQAFNEHSRVGMATFSWWLRKQEARHGASALPADGVNISYAFFALCLLAATATPPRDTFFYSGLALLVGWALAAARGRHRGFTLWAMAFLIIAAAGYGGYTGLYQLQKKLEEMNVAWFSRLLTSRFDDRESRTRLGAIGTLKLSDRIVLRLRTDGSAPPELLREASFNLYRGGLWNHIKSEFGSVFAEADGTTWKLLPQKEAKPAVTIAQFLRGGRGLLALPEGSAQLNDLPVVAVKTNHFGVVKVNGGPGLVLFEARYGEGLTVDTAPTGDDVWSVEETEPSIERVARELGLRPEMDPKEALRLVAAFFTGQFQYSTYLTAAHASTTNETALSRFLLHTRSGHCEYFATAATLLLREAGLPTRYAVGYSVQEGKGRKYVVRERHAHAWTLVYIDGAWRDFDTTPSSWNAIESQGTSWLQPIKDFFSNVWFQFSKFRWGKTEWRKYFMWAPAPLLLIVLVRFVLGKQWKRLRSQRKLSQEPKIQAGQDSEFYLVEKHFMSRGLARQPGECWTDWLRRVELNESSAAPLRRSLYLHQRFRFDPSGLNTDERQELRSEVKRWLRTRGIARTRRSAL